MNQKQQQKINRMLDTLFAFNPVSLRLILIDSNGKSGKGVKKGEKHYPFIKGTNNSLLETLDLKFLEIMRSQTELTIPDISKSAPFSGIFLEILELTTAEIHSPIPINIHIIPIIIKGIFKKGISPFLK